MKRIFISFIISFIMILCGVISIIIGTFQINQVALLIGTILIIFSSIFDFILGMILLRSWLIRKGE